MPNLAIKGGKPLRTESFPLWPQFDECEMDNLKRALEGRRWGTLGKEVEAFVKRFTEYEHCRYGLALNNGTLTLEVILRALEIGYGDEVIVPPYTFYSTVSSVMMVGATPVFSEIEADTYNIDPDYVERIVNNKTRAVIVVHIGGRPCDMDRILEIAQRHNLYIVEDCAHAHGSEFKGQRVGSFGDAGSFSFQGSKNLCCGEGGFITTNNKELYERCWSVHNCGRDYNSNIWYMHYNIGTNARMAEWEAAILDSQMNRLDEQIAIRQDNAAALNSMLEQIPCVSPLKHDERVTRNSYHLFIFKFISGNCKELSRERFIEAMEAEGIPCSPGYKCLYKMPVFESQNFKRVTGSKLSYRDLYLENAEKATENEGLWLGHPLLLGSKKDVRDVADAICKIYENLYELL